MGKSVVNASAVTFSAGSEVYVGPYGTSLGSLTKIGLLAQEMTLNLEQQFRIANDRYPEVEVARAIQSQALNLEFVLQELKQLSFELAFNLDSGDLTAVAGGDTVVSNEGVKLNADGVAGLRFPIKASVAPVVTNVGGTVTYVAGTDYLLVPRDFQGRTLIYRLSSGSIPAGANLEVDYTYNLPTRREYPLGRRTQPITRTLMLRTDLTNGGRLEFVMWRGFVGLRGGFNPNQNDTLGLPMLAAGQFDVTQDALGHLYEYAAA